MADISQHIQQQSQTVSAIFAHYKKVGDAQQARDYIGASIIGAKCERYLWYAFRGCFSPEFDGRMYRLFDTGNKEEARLVSDLRAVGCTVHEAGEDGKQFAVSAYGGHFSGHMDGCVLGVPEAPKTWHVAEFKTHNAKSYAKLVKEGVKQAKPQHYAQCQVYMHLSGMTRTLYLGVNKDTDDIYPERIRYNKDEAKQLMDRAKRIICSSNIPSRISDRPDWYECRYCDAHSICWCVPESVLPLPQVTCRTCCHATPITECESESMDSGPRWKCACKRTSIASTDMGADCEDHLVLPGLIVCAEICDAGNDYIQYILEDSSKFIQGVGGFSTKELIDLSPSEVVNPTLTKAKNLFGATVERVSRDDILSRYPESDCRIRWKGSLAFLRVAWSDRYKEEMESLEPIAKFEEMDFKAAEFSGGRVAIVWKNNQAEIREGIE